MRPRSSNSSSQAAQAMSDMLSTIMVLCRGKDENNQPCWAYLAIKPSMAKAFHDARERGRFEIGDYGTIIESGSGTTVPKDVQQRMARDYGVRNDYEEQLLNAVDKIRNTFFD